MAIFIRRPGRLKLAAAHWERAVDEWNKTVAPKSIRTIWRKCRRKLESAKVKLAKEEPAISSQQSALRRTHGARGRIHMLTWPICMLC